MRRANETEIAAFKRRRTRQIKAAATAIVLVMLVVVIYRWPHIFGVFPSKSLLAAEIIVIAGFIGYSAVNWICPSCKKYLGADINKNRCNKCGVRFC